MYIDQFFKGAIIGAVLLGVLSAICAAYIAFTSNTVGSFGLKTEDLWWLAMILGSICGVFIGGIIGGVIFGADLDIVKGLILAISIIAVPALFVTIFSADKFDQDIQRFGIFFAVLVFLMGIFIPTIKMLLSRHK